VGTLNSFATLARSVVLLMRVARSALATPKVICGCWSMNTTALSSGVYSSWYCVLLLFTLCCFRSLVETDRKEARASVVDCILLLRGPVAGRKHVGTRRGPS